MTQRCIPYIVPMKYTSMAANLSLDARFDGFALQKPPIPACLHSQA
jgi:hypothetical protein